MGRSLKRARECLDDQGIIDKIVHARTALEDILGGFAGELPLSRHQEILLTQDSAAWSTGTLATMTGTRRLAL